MAVDIPHSDDDLLRQPQFRRPFGAERTCGRIAAVRPDGQTPQDGQQDGVESGEELFGRISAPLFGPHHLRPGDAKPRPQILHSAATGQHGRNPVAQLDDGPRIAAQAPGTPQQVQDLRPETLRRIVVARTAGVIDFAAGAEGGDLLRLPLRRVVLPQNEHRIGILLITRRQRQRRAGTIDQTRRAGSRIHGDGAYRLRRRTLRNDLPQHLLQPLQIIQRMLAELRLRGIAVQTPAPAGVIADGDGNLFAGFGVGQQRPHRVGAVVYSNNVQVFHYSLFSVQIVRQTKGKREQNPLFDFANILKYCYKKKIFSNKFCKYKK